MIRSLCLLSLFCCLSCFTSVVGAATVTVNGIPSFDTNLGTLVSATVTIDPPPTPTSIYDPGFFEFTGNHAHIVNPFPASVTGLGSFPFVPTQTNFVDPNNDDSHFHMVNVPAAVEVFSGASLAWFLDPLNGVNFVSIVAPPTSLAEGHTHTVDFNPILPTTRFEFVRNQVPEPNTIFLFGMASLSMMARLRR